GHQPAERGVEVLPQDAKRAGRLVPDADQAAEAVEVAADRPLGLVRWHLARGKLVPGSPEAVKLSPCLEHPGVGGPGRLRGRHVRLKVLDPQYGGGPPTQVFRQVRRELMLGARQVDRI